MTESILLRLCVANAQLLGDLVDPWKTAHESAMRACRVPSASGSNRSRGKTADESAMRACDLEALIPKIIGFCDVASEVDQMLWEAARTGRIKQIQLFGESVVAYYSHLLSAFQDIQTLCRATREEGYVIEKDAEFERAVEGLARLKDLWVNRWPWSDPEMLKRTAGEFERGEFQSAKEALDELLHRHA